MEQILSDFLLKFNLSPVNITHDAVETIPTPFCML